MPRHYIFRATATMRWMAASSSLFRSSAVGGGPNSTTVEYLRSSSSTTTTSTSSHPPVCWLDLRGSGLSILERLSLEEALLRHDDKERSWIIVGTHEAHPHRYLQHIPTPEYCRNDVDDYPEGMIVMGIGGKAAKLVHIDAVQQDQMWVCKRFSGGGTVLLDSNSLWTTCIGRKHHFPSVDAFPRAIMEWSADQLFGPAFDRLAAEQEEQQKGNNATTKSNNQKQKTLVLDSKSCCGVSANLGSVISIPKSTTKGAATRLPKFALKENDYVLGDRKMGGNAQSIVKNGWLHHTSFLWDYDPEDMAAYLQLPSKRPDYRGDRAHDDFLVSLQPYLRHKKDLFRALLATCQENFDVEPVILRQVVEEVIDGKLGGMQTWWEKNRTKVVTNFEEP